MPTPNHNETAPEILSAEQRERVVVCAECNVARQDLSDDVDIQTRGSRHERLKYLAALSERFGFSNLSQTSEILLEYETDRRRTDPVFDVSKQPEKRLRKILQRNTERLQVANTNQKTRQIETEYQKSFSRLKASGHSNVEIIQTLINDPVTPTTERGKLQAFQSILSVAQSVPADAQIIATRMNTLDFSQGIPTPQEFVTWAVFDSPNLSSGISEATQATIAAKLGIRRHEYTVKTGGDVKEVFEKGLGVETYLDEHGEIQTRTVPLAPGKDVKIRDNQYLSVDNAGNKHLKITTAVGDYQISLPDNPTNEDMTQIVSSTQMIAAFHDLNLAEVFYDRPLTERGGGEIDLRFPSDFNRTKQLCQILFGGAAGYDGEILEQSDINKIPYLMQIHSSKGGAMRGDVAPEMMRKKLEAQDAIKNGSVNWLRFEEMVTTNRTNMYVAPENFAT